ncbi:MAG: phosphate transport regulator [Hydrogenophaga sp.]|uniref:phosphate transport regulator n=1 Tax=Hydrogenophaga sp. TaxID=1904254 RepID=UPI002ABBC7EF|nr:phosphate transport regulator [Hydrogenophaga sp.]MDZ4187340.1 phosphate transport regulator [Hydrogenophaga sp.]
MEKENAVASLGQSTLLLPAWVKAALQANDRLKLYLSVLQSAAQRAANPGAAFPDWAREIVHLGLRDASWLKDVATTAYLQDQTLIVPELSLWLGALASDLSIMARPLCDVAEHKNAALAARRDRWLKRIEELNDEEGLSPQALNDLTHGNRHGSDSFHLLVMDLHKQLNTMAVAVATEDVDGAHVWQVQDSDRPLIRAFMRGLARTAALKFNHPGLDTAVTRDGERLLIQNDIGTNDAHVLVIEVQGRNIHLTYSDLHVPRFGFFRQMLEGVGFEWTVFDPRTTAGLNQGKPYQVGHAVFMAADDEALQVALEAVASRIVFVIDWNRARKRLQEFVRKPVAMAVLRDAADHDMGHMAWLLAGGEQLIYEAMQAVDADAFRIGDRLDQVLGEAATEAFLQDLLRMSSIKLRQQQPVALIADEARLLLARVLQRRTFEFDLLAEHAAFCHALALALSEALEFASTTADSVQRAKNWERKADHLLMEARRRAERQPRWLPMVQLLDDMDDTADALEEATFIHSMTLTQPLAGLPPAVNEVLAELADTTLAAIQDQIKAIEIARHMSEHTEPADSEAFLQALWRMLRAERICDDLLRSARARIVHSLHATPALFSLATELAATIEKATDSLLRAGYALRKLVFNKSGMTA